MSLSIAFVTARKNCKLDWLVDSLRHQIRPEDGIRLIITDFWNQVVDDWTEDDVAKRSAWVSKVCSGFQFKHVNPKPNVWSGPTRLPKDNFFSAASSRNSAICVCETTHLAIVDDLSVASEHWLQSVREAIAGNYFMCGAYKKLKDMVVENGFVTSFTPHPEGEDNRLRQVSEDVSKCHGGWLYGCSMAGSLESYLNVGGFFECCDSMGFEDVTTGIALVNSGADLRYDRRALTYESEELHYVEKPFKRIDKGISPRDRSHCVLDIARQSKYFPNYYEGGVRALRDYMLAGNSWPACAIPQHDFFDGQPISEM